MLETPPNPMAEPGRGGAPPTFAACATWYIELRRPLWTSPKQAVRWEQTLTRHAYPHIGHKSVDQVTQADVLAVLEPLWVSRHDTGLRVRQQIHTILEWADGQGYRHGSNPANNRLIFQSLSPVSQAVPRRALSHTEVPAALRRVAQSTAYPPTRLSFRFMVLTAAWPGDVRLIEWDEIDWERRVWTVPANTVRRPHHIPLSNQALHLLEGAWHRSRPGGLVFPAGRGGGAVSNAAVLRLLRRLDIPAAPSGFRASFRDWCVENGVPPMLAKAVLSRTAGRNSGKATFLRTNIFERMRELMQQWGDYIMPEGWAGQGGKIPKV